MKIITLHTLRSTFEITEAFLNSFQEIQGKNVELQIQHNVTFNQKDDAGDVILSLHLIVNKNEVFSHVARIQLEDIPASATLTDIVFHPHIQAALLRHWGSVVNNVNWLMMNSPIGPLPIHAHLIHDIFLQMVKNQGQEKAMA